jgi:molybdate transport system ATP-binding protein
MTLGCIAGLERPEQGRVLLNGRTLLDTNNGIDLAPAKRRIGVVFQDYALFPHLTVEKNIAFGLSNSRTGNSKGDSAARVEEFLALFELDPLARSYPRTLRWTAAASCFGLCAHSPPRSAAAGRAVVGTDPLLRNRVRREL